MKKLLMLSILLFSIGCYEDQQEVADSATVKPVIENPVIENPVVENPVVENPVVDSGIYTVSYTLQQAVRSTAVTKSVSTEIYYSPSLPEPDQSLDDYAQTLKLVRHGVSGRDEAGLITTRQEYVVNPELTDYVVLTDIMGRIGLTPDVESRPASGCPSRLQITATDEQTAFDVFVFDMPINYKIGEYWYYRKNAVDVFNSFWQRAQADPEQYISADNGVCQKSGTYVVCDVVAAAEFQEVDENRVYLESTDLYSNTEVEDLCIQYFTQSRPVQTTAIIIIR